MATRRKPKRVSLDTQNTQAALTREQVSLLKAKADEYKKAQKDITNAAGVLWNARLDMAINSGKAEHVEEALINPIGPIGLWDDCNCNQKSCMGKMDPKDILINPDPTEFE